MSHYAKVLNGVVVNVITAEAAFFNTFVDTSPGTWVQTSYNTRGGVHLLGGTPMRKNYAGVGYTYNPTLDAFYAPQPYPSWTLNATSCLWQAPVAMPSTGGPYKWNEATLAWVTAS
jgi:hypothetical protein